MKVKTIDDSYVAGKFERLYEDKVVSFLQENDIELLEIRKFGHYEGEHEYKLIYDVHVKNTSRENDSLLGNKLGLIYVDTFGIRDTYTISFFWDLDDAESMEEFYNRLTTIFGFKLNKILHDDTMKRLKRGIKLGELEIIRA